MVVSKWQELAERIRVTDSWLTRMRASLAWCLRWCLCFSMSFSLCIGPSYAQRWDGLSDTIFKHFTTENGLPHGVVTAIVEDQFGFIWVGTQGGLARWDGYRFQVYLPKTNDPSSLPNNFVQALHKDSKGQMWVATTSGGIARYDPFLDQFVRLAVGKNGLSHAQANSITDDGNGGIWVATNGGLDHVENDGKRIQNYHHQPGVPGTLLDEVVRAVLYDKQGRLWVGTRKGLQLRKDGKFVDVSLPVGLGSGASEKVAQIRSLQQSADGQIWIGTTGQGAYVLGLDGQTRKIVETNPENTPNLAVNLAQETVSAILEVEPGVMWLATYGRGLFVVRGNPQDPRYLQTSRLMRDPHASTSLLSNMLHALWRDHSGLVWVGTVRGLSRHEPTQKGILTLYNSVSRRANLPDVDAAYVATFPDGSVWLGLYGKGINVIDKEARHVNALTFEKGGDYAQFKGANVVSIAALPDGNAFIGSSRGLFYFDQSNKRLTKIPIGNLLAHEAVRESLLLGDTLWVGSEDSLWRIDLANKAIADLRAELVTPLAKQSISALEAGENNTLWVGSRTSGLFHYDIGRNTSQRYVKSADDQNSLSANHVSCLMLDDRQRLWIGTLGGGINILDLSTKHTGARFEKIGSELGLRNPMIGKILRSREGEIWASTANGLAKIDANTLAVREMTSADGVVVPSYWVNSGVLSEAGELLFTGIGGMTVARPDMLKPWQYVAPVMLTSLQVGGKFLPVGSYNATKVGDKKPKLAEVLVSPQENSLSVEFSSLDYSAPHQNRYAYRLIGYDKDWQSTDASRRVASYTNLPPGRYQLSLRGANRNGQWNEEARNVPIRVLPAWHQTWWFMLLQWTIAGSLIFVVVQARTKLLRKRQQELADTVAKRTCELQQKQSQLQEKNQELQGANLALNHANDALNGANHDLAMSVETLRQLGDIGRDITANLDAEVVFHSLSQYVGGLLDAPFLTIYRMNQDGNALELAFGREDGEILPKFSILLSDPISNVARVARNRQEMLLKFDPDIISPTHIPGTRMMATAMYAPLIVDDKVLGVMSIQSARVDAYGERESLIFRTLSSYGAIALANAQTLTALHQAQAQLVQQEKLASLGGLVAGIAHEINTPLGTTMLAISGIADQWQSLQNALQNGSISNAMVEQSARDGAEYASLAMQNATRAAEMITSFKSIAVQGQSMPRSRVELSLYLSEVAMLVHSALVEKGCGIEFDVPMGLAVHVVPEVLTETLIRIFANVLDHAFCNGRKGKMHIGARSIANAMVEIEISDDGDGIAAHHLAKVFDPFFTSKGGNLGHVGLGLHMAFNHVTQGLQGSIRIASVEGEGTKVTICVPAATPNAVQ